MSGGVVPMANAQVRVNADGALVVSLDGGAATATSVATETLTATGVVTLSGLPTSDPGVAGQLWVDTGVVKVSAGA